jgi:serine phosphatase RsbU (regulator of sigma subunit)
LIRIRNNELTEFEADKMPIGIYDKMDSFASVEIKYERGDVFYMFSDGYKDQFGGPERKKFKSKNFKIMLTEISSLPMADQKVIIEKRFEQWKGDHNQVDDIAVAGFRL